MLILFNYYIYTILLRLGFRIVCKVLMFITSP